MDILINILQYPVTIFAAIASGILVIWKVWRATQMNEIELLIAGNDWKSRHDIGQALVVFLTIYLCNWSLGLSMNKNGILIFLLLATLSLFAFTVCLIINEFNKSELVLNIGNLFAMIGIYLYGWVFSSLGYTYLTDEKNAIPGNEYVVYLVVVLAISLLEGLCSLLLLSTVKKNSHIILNFQKYDYEDKSLYIYSRIGDDLICGDSDNIRHAENIISIPIVKVKEEKYSFRLLYQTKITDSKKDDSEEKANVIINANRVIVSSSNDIDD